MSWELGDLWQSMSGLAQGVVCLLLVMMVRAMWVTTGRGARYLAAHRQSRTFLKQIVVPLKNCNLAEAISIAEKSVKSHLAPVVASGLNEFLAASPTLSNAERLTTAQRGMDRSANYVQLELKRGLGGLATIGATAPFVGLFGTVVGIVHAFKGCIGEKSACMAATAGGIAEALVTTALGLLVAVPAVWCYNYLSNKMERFVIEMKDSSTALISVLTICIRQRRQS